MSVLSAQKFQRCALARKLSNPCLPCDTATWLASCNSYLCSCGLARTHAGYSPRREICGRIVHAATYCDIAGTSRSYPCSCGLSIHTPDAPRGVSNAVAFLTLRRTATWLVYVALIIVRVALSVHTPDAPRGVSNVAAFLTLRHTAT